MSKESHKFAKQLDLIVKEIHIKYKAIFCKKTLKKQKNKTIRTKN